MAAPRSRRCSLSLLTLFSITLILISVSLFVSTKPANKPFLDYRNQFSISISISSPLEQNTTNTSFVSASPPLSPLGQSNTTNTILASSSSSSSFSDHQNQNKSPSPTSKKIVIRKRSGLDKIESDLAKARAAIKKAASTQNYVSSLYKNPAAFHQLSFAILLLLLFLTI
jgi:xylogalacturonan beta-1,3-xylosyltransferase